MRMSAEAPKETTSAVYRRLGAEAALGDVLLRAPIEEAQHHADRCPDEEGEERYGDGQGDGRDVGGDGLGQVRHAAAGIDER
jgi:hypothetical protein